MLSVQKTTEGESAVDGAALVMATAALLSALFPLMQAVQKGITECPDGAMPCIGLDEPTLRSFGVICKRAAAVQAALNEAFESCRSADGDNSALASMETAGRA